MNGRLARLVAVFVAVVLIVIPIVINVSDSDEDQEVYAERRGDDSELDVLDVRPDAVPPGGMIVVRFDHPAHDDAPQTASLRMPHRDVDAVQVREQEAVFKVPIETGLGPVGVQLVVGERVSETRFVRVARSNVLKSYRNVVGGLGLMLVGLLLLSHGVRHRAGRTLRRRASGLTSGTFKSLGLGVGVGGLVQTSTFMAGLALPSVERQLVGISAAAALLIGTQLGAVAVGAVLPLAGGDLAALVIILGVLFRLTATARRSVAAANVVMGLGVLMLGTAMLGTGFAPLAERSDWLLWLSALQPDTIQGVFVLSALGALAAVLTQGPVPVFVLVVGVAQTTSFLSTEQGLAVLCGTPVGAALSTMLLSSPLRTTARRLGVAHMALALLTTLGMWLLLPVAPRISAAALGTDPAAVEYAKKVLHPNAAAHLSVGIVVLQCVATALVVPLIPRVARLLQPTRQRNITSDLSGDVPPFAAVVAQLRDAVDAVPGVLRGQPGKQGAMQAHVMRARALLEALLTDAKADDPNETVSASAVLLAVEHLRDIVDRARRRGIALQGEEAQNVESLHAGVVAGLADIRSFVWGEPGPTLQALRAREIQINATEAAQREAVGVTLAGTGQQPRHALILAEIASGYEALGNQLYRWAVAHDAKDSL